MSSDQVYSNYAKSVGKIYIDDRVTALENAAGGGGLFPPVTVVDSIIAYDDTIGTQSGTGLFAAGASRDILDANGVYTDDITNPGGVLHIGTDQAGLNASTQLNFHNIPVTGLLGSSYSVVAPVNATDSNVAIIDNALNTIQLEYATSTRPGVLSTTTQSIGGRKSFLSGIGTCGDNNSIEIGNASGGGQYSVHIGDSSGALASTATGNVCVGFNNATTLTIANQNVSVGSDTFSAVTGGSQNTVVGNSALTLLQTGDGNVAIGYQSMFSTNNNISRNVGIGYQALRVATNSDAVAVGYQASLANTTGINTCIGAYSGNAITTGSGNTLLGRNSGSGIVSGSNNIAIGFETLFTGSNTVANTVAIGHQALRANTGPTNLAVGYQALRLNTSGDNNLAIGDNALGACTTGGSNFAIGASALSSVTTGVQQMAIGSGTGRSITTSTYNLLIGQDTAPVLATGSGGNCVLGSGAAYNMTTGSTNTVIGQQAMPAVVSGTGNIVIGQNAGNSMNAGNSGNIVIGNTGAAASNRIYIGTGQTRCHIAGIRGVTTAVADAIAVLIDSAGQLGTTSSSAFLKTEISPMESMLAKVADLVPSKFKYVQDVENDPVGAKFTYGCIEDEFRNVFPELCVGIGFDELGREKRTIQYHLLTPIMLKCIQELMLENDSLSDRITALENRLPA